MKKNNWTFFTNKELKPAGWMKKQLQIQAAGLSGNLDKIWPDIRDSKWIGGNAEGWERVPYWLDGFIPLAYLLEDEDMIHRAKNYIDAILHFQKPDGWICPCSDEERTSYDTWVVLLISKVLKVYYDCSGDERIPDVIYRILKNFYDLLASEALKLFRWGKYRWYEGFIAINFLYQIYQEDWIIELAKILYIQGKNYDECIEDWKRPINKWTFDTHIVNLCMMLKSEAVSCDILGNDYTDLAEKYYTILKEYNGTPVELFTGDECLSGLSPIQGTELCAVVELMYAYELLYAYTGDRKWAERLEIVAFNALPATCSDDMWAHQYVQQSNQITCKTLPGRSVFRTNGPEAHLFGLEPHYGCCTANMHQGWPKLALSSFMDRTDESGESIINVLTIPSVLNTQLNTPAGKADLCICLDTCYPFENIFSYKLTANVPVSFSFKIRIPSFANDIRLNSSSLEEMNSMIERYEFCMDKENAELTIQLKDCTDLQFTLSYNTKPELIDRPHDLKTAKCGSLIYSLPISYTKNQLEYIRNNVERKFPYCDYEYIGTSDWAFAFAEDNFERVLPEDSGYLVAPDSTDFIFSSENPPVMLKAKMQPIAWGLEDGFETVCAKIPESRECTGEIQEVMLYPYGCAKLRMTEMPLLK